MAEEPTKIEETKKRPRIFYGWWLLGAGMVILIMQGGLYAYGFSAFFVPLAATLGTSRGVLSMAFSFTRIEAGLIGPLEGFLIDRFGPRGVMYVGFALFGLGFALFSFVDSLLTFYLIFPMVALGASLSGFLPVVTAVNNWFSRRRGLATGITSSGVNIGGALVAVVAMGITHYGWRTAALLIGVVILMAGPPLAAMMRHRPQQYGYLPDGDDPDSLSVSADESTASSGGHGSRYGVAQGNPDFTAMQALKTKAFWVISLCHGLSILVISAVTIHEIPLLVDAGLSFQTAASILAFMTAVAWVGRIVGGYLGDKIGAKIVLVACFFLMGAGVLVLATAQTVFQAIVFAILYGLGYGARAPILIALRGEFFGPRNFGTIMGLSQPIQMIGSFSGPVIAGFAFDIQGSYRMVFTAIAVVNAIGALLVFFIKKPEFPQSREASHATGS